MLQVLFLQEYCLDIKDIYHDSCVIQGVLHDNFGFLLTINLRKIFDFKVWKKTPKITHFLN